MAVNSVVVTGNLTRNAELRMTQTGTAVLKMGVAVNDRRKGESGEWEDHANFIDCVMFGTRAEKVAPYLLKGTKVGISGKLSQSRWQQDGQSRSKIEVLVDDLDFMGRREEGQAQEAPGRQARASFEDDEEIPF